MKIHICKKYKYYSSRIIYAGIPPFHVKGGGFFWGIVLTVVSKAEAAIEKNEKLTGTLKLEKN